MDPKHFLRMKWNPRRKPLKTIMLDSGIIAAITFFAILPAHHLPNACDIYAALRAFFYAFVTQVALNLGLIRGRGRNEAEGLCS